MGRPVESIPGPHWDSKAATLAEHLVAVAAKRGDGTSVADVNTRPERLKYMHKYTLGCK